MLQLPTIVNTRWNSTFLMLERAMRLKTAIDKLLCEHADGDTLSEITQRQWQCLDTLTQLLVMSKNATKMLEKAHDVTSGRVIVTFARLHMYWKQWLHDNVESIKEGRAVAAEVNAIQGMVQAMINKLDMEWDDPELCMAWMMCTLVDVSVAWKGVQDSYEFVMEVMTDSSRFPIPRGMEKYQLRAEKSSFLREVKELLVDHAKDLVARGEIVLQGREKRRRKEEKVSVVLHSDDESDECLDDSCQEVEQFMAERRTMVRPSHVLEWWRVNSGRHPVVSELARRYLAVPASSASSERAFSKVGHIVRCRRSRLSDDHIAELSFMSSL